MSRLRSKPVIKGDLPETSRNVTPSRVFCGSCQLAMGSAEPKYFPRNSDAPHHKICAEKKDFRPSPPIVTN